MLRSNRLVSRRLVLIREAVAEEVSSLTTGRISSFLHSPPF